MVSPCARKACFCDLIIPADSCVDGLAVDFFVNQLDEPRILLDYDERVDLESRARRKKRQCSSSLS
jgi:hypothetical protein